MIVGLGTDVVNVERIKKIYKTFGNRFISKVFTLAEQKEIESLGDFEQKKICKLAKLFAAKESAAKALGTGFSEGISWQDIEISHDEKGKPLIELKNKALEKACRLTEGKKWRALISVSDDYPWAQAIVIIEKYC